MYEIGNIVGFFFRTNLKYSFMNNQEGNLKKGAYVTWHKRIIKNHILQLKSWLSDQHWLIKAFLVLYIFELNYQEPERVSWEKRGKGENLLSKNPLRYSWNESEHKCLCDWSDWGYNHLICLFTDFRLSNSMHHCWAPCSHVWPSCQRRLHLSLAKPS